MTQGDTTKLAIHEDKATAISSESHGSNLTGVGFNLIFIALRQPGLAIKIIELYKEAYRIHQDDSKVPDEDYNLALSELADLMKPKS